MPIATRHLQKNIGQTLGEGLGGVIGSGLEGYASGKLQELAHGQTTKRLEDAGIPKEYAAILARYEPKQQMEGIQNYFQGLQSFAQGQQQQPDALQQLQGELPPEAYRNEYPIGEEGRKLTQQDEAAYRQKQQPQQKPTLANVLGSSSKPITEYQKAQLSAKEQAALDKDVAPIAATYFKASKKYEELKPIAERMIKRIKDKKIKVSGFEGKFKSQPWLKGALLTKDEQAQLADAERIVTILASTGGGNMSKFRLQQEAASKASLDLDLAAQDEILNNLLKAGQKDDATYKEILKLKKANAGRYPATLRESIGLDGEIDLGSQKEAQPDMPPQEIIDQTAEGDFINFNGKPVFKKVNGELVRV